MHLLARDILEVAKDLPVALTAATLAIGFLLWLTGWDIMPATAAKSGRPAARPYP